MKASSLLQYRKDPRVIITAPLLIFTATSLVYYLIQQAKELSPEALSSRVLLFVLWNINLILILGIVFVLLRGVVKLVLERQRGILGSRFRSKLVATYVITSLLPIGLLFFVATDLLRVSIDRWFNTPVRALLQNSEAIAQAAQNRTAGEAESAAREIAEAVQLRGSADLEKDVSHVLRFHNVDLAGLYEKGIIVRLSTNPRAPIDELPEPSTRFFEEVLSTGWGRKMDIGPQGKWIRHAVRVRGPSGEQVAMAGVFLPNNISRLIDANIIAHKHFQQLDSQRAALKASQTSLFLTVTLSILFGVLWTSMYASRRITGPVRALAEGTSVLAAGGYGHRIQMKAADEFGTLIDSFNKMASQLESQRGELTESNTEMQSVNRRLDQERAYLSTVLESVSTGIMAFNDQLELLSINRAAIAMLNIAQPPGGAKLGGLLPDELASLREHLMGLKEQQPSSRELTIVRAGELRHLEVSAARLNEPGRGGWVVAIEDLTELVKAQKLAAWSEAARRIAHEIKNPLTPIQLSAERIARKFRNNDPGTAAAVEEGCQTIVAEVRHLKTMVDEFSRFARMPAIHLRQTNLSQIFEEVARLYRDIKPGVTVRTIADPTLEVVLDREQIRRALVNLLDNAIEATERGEILLSGELSSRGLLIKVQDPGRGIPETDKERLFLPHFSTKREGTGLGLAIVHRIVHDHDGRITVYDNRPAGTRFEIEIPV